VALCGLGFESAGSLKLTNMTTLIRTDSTNEDFIKLVQQLDAELAIRDGNEHAFYHQFNKIDMIKHAIVAYENGEPVGCGAIKEFESNSMEVKRMFTQPEFRGKGVASNILKALETWAAELSYQKCILETGKRQPEAIALYTRSGYNIIPNYGQYAGIENSVCFEKNLNQPFTPHL
jgi:putative acetyltransferase